MKRAVVCPSCGTAQDDSLPEEASQVRCRSCGYSVALSSDIMGSTELCSNHFDALSVGTCHACGKRLCENCLYVHRTNKREYVCEACLEGTKRRDRVNRILVGVPMTIIMVYLFPLGTTWHTSYPLYAILGILEGLWIIFGPIRYPLLAEQYGNEANESIPSTYSVYVKCLNCGAAYHYGPDKVGPDVRVVCQNCNRTLDMDGAPIQT